MKLALALALLIALTGLAAGCGSGGTSPPQTASRATTSTTSALTTTSAPTTTAAVGAPALQAEATSAAAGDIPDNQVFVAYRNAQYSLEYPEGWAETGGGAKVTFRDKNNIVRVVVDQRRTPPATIAGATITSRPSSLELPGGRAVKVTYKTVSAPSPVTGKRVTLTVDRYTIAGKRGEEAVIDLGTPVGVDNVDAYRLMIESFRWR